MDHYPANLSSSAGMIFMTTSNVFCLSFVFIHSFLTKPELSLMIKWYLLFGPLFFMYFSVVNIFSDNLYEHGYSKAPDYSKLNATELAKATANMTIDEIDGISKSEWKLVISHTTWFICWLVAHIIYNVLYWQHIIRIQGTKYYPNNNNDNNNNKRIEYCCKHWASKKFIQWLICFLLFFSYVVFTLQLMVMVFAHDGNDRFHSRKNPLSFIHSIVYACFKLKVEYWFYITSIANQLYMPKDVGLHFEFKLEKDYEMKKGVSTVENGKWITKHIYPANIISGGFKLLCCLMVFTYSFKQIDINGKSSILPLASGFKEKPFRYIFAPSWVLLSGIIGAGTYLLSVRESLSHRNSPRRVKAMKILAFLCVLFLLLGVWSIIPNTKIGGYMVVIAMILFPCWVGLAYGELHQIQEERVRLCIFFILYLIFAITSPLHPIMNTLLLVLLAVFDQIVPEYKFSDGLTMIVYPVICDEATTTIIDTTTTGGGGRRSDYDDMRLNVVANSGNSGVEMNVVIKTTSTI